MASDDSDIEVATSSKRSKRTKHEGTQSEGGADDAPEDSQSGGGDDDDEGEEEEYEIERILNHRRDFFGPGKCGYFVKWKGYGSSDNSWVNEDDAANAQDLITKYWARQKKASKEKNSSIKSGRSKTMTAPASRSRHKSETVDVDQEESVSAPVKKRSRQARAPSDEMEITDIVMGTPEQIPDSEDEEELKPKKRSKKSAAIPTPKKSTKAQENGDTSAVDDDGFVGDMSNYMKMKDWDHLIESVETVERNRSGKIIVYFILTTGERVKEKSSVCAERFPLKLLKFYEDNLKWNKAEEEVDDE